MASKSFPLNRMALIGLIVVISTFYHSSVQAAAPVKTTPIIFLVDGDLWEVSAPGQPVNQLTHWGHNFNPVLSPDGQQVAYLSQPDGSEGSGAPVGNVWVLNLSTGKSVRIAGQPTNASQNNDWIKRPTPAWSPDSTQLAWVEEASGSSQLVTYDVASQKNTLTVDAPGYVYAPGSYAETGEPVAWSSAGIAYTLPEYSFDIFLVQSQPIAAPHMWFYLYSTNGNQLIAQSLPEQTCGMYAWAQNSKTNKPVPLFCDGDTVDPTAFDLARKINIPFPGRLTLYSSSGTDSGVTVTCDVPPVPAIQPCPSSCWPLDNSDNLLATVGLSPDGQNVVEIAPAAKAAYTVYSGSSQTPTTYQLDVPGNSSIDWVGWGPTALKFTQLAGHEGTCPSG